jgi:hypothetical protein
MKKLCLLLLLCCPMLLVAQEKTADSTPKLRKREIAISSLPFLRLAGINPLNQPFLVEYKQLIGKRYLRLAVETYTSNKNNGELKALSIKDSLLIIDNTITSKSSGYFKVGIERQRLSKSNPRFRFRTGIDALIGTQSESLFGSYAELDVKKNILKSKDYSRKDFEGKTYLTTGLAAFTGLDYLLGERTYLGMNVNFSFLYTPKKNNAVYPDMRISPYLAWKF